MDIDISNIPYYSSSLKQEQEQEEQTKYTTQIKIYNDCISLLEISEKILSTGISGYNIVMKYDFVTVKEKNGHKIVETSKTKQKYVILYYEFLDHIDFNDFLFRCLLTPKLLVLHITTSYKTILKSLEQLEISFSSFSSNNLVFDKNSYNPIVTGLEDVQGTKNDVAVIALNELYLSIIQTIIFAFSLENTILNDLCTIIEERKEKEKEGLLLSKINKLFSTDKWSFVNAMKQDDIDTFREQFY